MTLTFTTLDRSAEVAVDMARALVLDLSEQLGDEYEIEGFGCSLDRVRRRLRPVWRATGRVDLVKRQP